MSDLASLAARVEQAEGPSRELDAEISIATMTWKRLHAGSADHPAFTASLDAALTLVPEGFEDWQVADLLETAIRGWWRGEQHRASGRPNADRSQLARFVCAAALRAKEKSNG